MKVVITGGAGFIGLQLARRLTALGTLTGPSGRPEKIDEVLLFDVVTPENRPQGLDQRAKFVSGEIADKATVKRLFDRPDLSVFHLASVVSGGGEQDFDLAMRVNLDGNLHVLESARALGSRPRVVFASSIAVFGGKAMPKHVGDTTKQTPQTTYGMTKAIGELLVNDYTRKSFIDGRSARLPARGGEKGRAPRQGRGAACRQAPGRVRGFSGQGVDARPQMRGVEHRDGRTPPTMRSADGGRRRECRAAAPAFDRHRCGNRPGPRHDRPGRPGVIGGSRLQSHR